MKKNPPRTAWQAVSLLLSACLLSGCAALLERSYSAVEPYSNRYWDSGAEDTLRVENYQDLVTSLLMLIEEGAEEGVIRCYGETGEFQQLIAARDEVRRETMLGAYLLQELAFSSENGNGYSTVTYVMSYREDAEDIDSIMTLSDTQSLVDLLRLAVREELEKLTARFTYDTPREDVLAAVESLWQELCRQEMEDALLVMSEENLETDPEEVVTPEDEDQTEENDGEPPEEDAPMPEPADLETAGEESEFGEEPPEAPVDYPPCPWLVQFYPDRETAEIVEVILQP